MNAPALSVLAAAAQVSNACVANTKLILDEDMAVSDHQARGLRSRHARPGRLCKHEMLLSTFHKWLADTVYRPALAEGSRSA